MKLYIMRHGPAEDDSPSGRDADRPLTPAGRDRVENVARELVRRDEAPRRIVTSPLVRARETAEIVARVAPPALMEIRRELAIGGASSEVVKEIVGAARDRAMIVGHQPDLSSLIAELTGLSVEMKKGMVVGLAVREGTTAGSRRRFDVLFVLDPHTLEDVTTGRA